MDDEDDGGVLARAFRSPVRDVVEGDTVNPNYHEITAPRPGDPGSLNERVSRGFGEYREPPAENEALAYLRRKFAEPLNAAQEHLPPGAMEILSAVLPGPKASIRPSARPPLPDIPAPAIQAGKQTVTQPYRNLFPGIYDNPKEMVAEAASRSVPESENLQKVFPRVSRQTLAEINQSGTRQGNVDPSSYLALAPNARGSESAPRVMNRGNEQRILDIATEAGKYPNLRDMDNWYVMDPVYQRMAQLFGPDEAKQRFRFLQAMMGMASPGSEVTTEIPRGLVAHYLAHQGRFQDFVNFGGKTSRMEDATGIAMPGHPYHKTSQAGPMERYTESGDLASSMKSPKVPNCIMAHGVPETGFQTKNAVPDAHWSRLVGLGDARRGPSDIGASASMSEMQDLWPWWQKQIAAKLGIEPVPAQARVWGAGSGKTGVSSPIGPSKLELLSDHIAKTAHRLGVSPETARDMILTGTAYRQGGMVHKDEGGSAGKRLSDVDPAALAAHREQYGEDTNPQQIEPDPNRPEYTGQILDFKEHPWHHLFNWARQIPMSMGYTGAAEGAATMGALGHILKSVLNRGARGPAGARYAPTTPAPSTDMGPPLASLERARMSRALHDEPPLRVELHGKIPGDAEVREDGGRTGMFANPNVSPDKFDQGRLFADGGLDQLETPRMHRIYEPRHEEPSENFEDRRDDSLPIPGSKRDLFYSIATHSLPEMDEASMRMLTRQKKHK